MRRARTRRLRQRREELRDEGACELPTVDSSFRKTSKGCQALMRIWLRSHFGGFCALRRCPACQRKKRRESSEYFACRSRGTRCYHLQLERVGIPPFQRAAH